jgi:hypothetical protein
MLRVVCAEKEQNTVVCEKGNQNTVSPHVGKNGALQCTVKSESVICAEWDQQVCAE